jgi:hypothetical protein
MQNQPQTMTFMTNEGTVLNLNTFLGQITIKNNTFSSLFSWLRGGTNVYNSGQTNDCTNRNLAYEVGVSSTSLINNTNHRLILDKLLRLREQYTSYETSTTPAITQQPFGGQKYNMYDAWKWGSIMNIRYLTSGKRPLPP